MDDLLELFVLVAWCLWFNHNEVKLGKARLQGLAVLQKARYMLDEFQTANLKLSQTNPKEEVRWEPPSDLWYKINSDDVIFESTSSIGVGAIIRDHDGQVEVALSKSLLVPLGPLEA